MDKKINSLSLKYPYPSFPTGIYLPIEPEGFVFTVNTIVFLKEILNG